ncbi:MAG: hypothetical protein R2838_12460 [Caldilineaceae bacterium]
MSVLALVDAMGEVVHSAPQPDDVAAPQRAQVAPSQSDNQVAEQAASQPSHQHPAHGHGCTPRRAGTTADRHAHSAVHRPGLHGGMLSLPRDLWVHMPGVDVTTKINTAYRLGESTRLPGRRSPVDQGHSWLAGRAACALLRAR